MGSTALVLALNDQYASLIPVKLAMEVVPLEIPVPKGTEPKSST